MDKPKLKAISEEDFIASSGKFRAVIMIDSDTYQVDDDFESFTVAKMRCYDAGGLHNPVAIFNDQGKNVLKD